MATVALLAQASPLLIYSAGAGAGLVTADPWPIWFTAGALVLGGGLNRLLKHSIASTEWGRLSEFQRPNPPKGGCGYFPGQAASKSRSSFDFGFPSGHSQVASFSAMFWSLYIARSQQRQAASVSEDTPEQWSRGIRIAILWLLAFGIFYSRLQIGCHNELQVAAGGAIGAALGAFYYFLLESLLKQ